MALHLFLSILLAPCCFPCAILLTLSGVSSVDHVFDLVSVGVLDGYRVVEDGESRLAHSGEPRRAAFLSDLAEPVGQIVFVVHDYTGALAQRRIEGLFRISPEALARSIENG